MSLIEEAGGHCLDGIRMRALPLFGLFGTSSADWERIRCVEFLCLIARFAG